MTEEKINKVKDAITALLEALSYYVDWNGVKAYWDSYEEYDKFYQNIADACNILEKELVNEENR